MKKLLCGMLAIILVFSIFAACGETEKPTNPTTTTQQATTENKNASGDLGKYVGYWFISENDMTFDNTNLERYADIQLIYISEINDEGRITYHSHLFDKNSFVTLSWEPTPWTFLSRAPIGVNGKNTFTVSKYGDTSLGTNEYIVEMKDDKLVVDGGEMVFSYRTDDSSVFDAVMAHDEQVFRNRYEGYWYMYDTSYPSQELKINELHIKDISGDRLKVDYSIGDYQDMDVVLELKKGKSWYSWGAFEIDTGVYATLQFSEAGKIRLYIGDDVCYGDVEEGVEYIGTFSDNNIKPYDSNEKNYNLNDYKGYWYVDDVEEDWINEPGIGYHEVYVKEINGNKVTFGYQFAGVTADIVTVEINNNVGVFDTRYMGEDGGKGVIRFDEDKIYIEVRPAGSDYAHGLNGTFNYQRTYSLRRDGWSF